HWRDEERHEDFAFEAGFAEKLLLVAVRDLVLVLLDVAADDRLIEIADTARCADDRDRNQRRAAPTGHATTTGTIPAVHAVVTGSDEAVAGLRADDAASAARAAAAETKAVAAVTE